MRFEYETKQDDRECVAVVHRGEHGQSLCIKTNGGCTFIYDNETYEPNHGSNADWIEELRTATVKLYKGDQITITL